MPFTARLFQRPIRTDRALSSRTSHRKLHGEDRDAHTQQEQQIEQDEYAAAVLSRYIRKPPHISNSDRTARAYQ